MATLDKQLEGIKVLFVSSTDYSNRTRELREATSLFEAGAEAHVIGYADTVPDIWRHSNIVVHEFKPRPRPALASENRIRLIRIAVNLSINVLRRAFRKYVLVKMDHNKFVQKACLINPDVVHAMDLPSLREAAQIARKCGAKLVYDSSEYWQGFLQNKVWDKCEAEKREFLGAEKKYIQEASLVLTTSNTMSIALKADYNIKSPIIHLYNAPFCAGRYPSLRPVKDNLKVVFHGNISPDRNLEGLLAALAAADPSITLDVYGNFVLGMQEICEKIVSDNALEDRVTFHGGFTYGEMLDFLPQYDVGFYPAYATDGNFDITLPNKIFDCICSGLAVVVPEFDSMKRLVGEIGNGIIVNTSSVTAMTAVLSQLSQNYSLVNEYKKHSCRVAHDFSWEAQGEKLVNAYAKLMDKIVSVIS